MGKRVFWALVLGLGFLSLCMQSLPWVIAIFGITNAVGQYEHCGLATRISNSLRIWHTALSTLLFVVVSLALADVISPVWVLIGLLLLVRVYLVPMIGSFDQAQKATTDYASYLLLIRSLVLVTLPLACIPAIAAWDSTTPFFLLLIGASWGADSGAMISGKLVGKTHPWPVLSPKKTAEGVWGGVLASALIWASIPFIPAYANAEGFTWLAMATLSPAIKAAILFVLGGMLGFVGIYGDLTFSLFKREAQVKDYGGSIPGHGGVLDRFDSMLFVAPIMYLLCFLNS